MRSTELAVIFFAKLYTLADTPERQNQWVAACEDQKISLTTELNKQATCRFTGTLGSDQTSLRLFVSRHHASRSAIGFYARKLSADQFKTSYLSFFLDDAPLFVRSMESDYNAVYKAQRVKENPLCISPDSLVDFIDSLECAPAVWEYCLEIVQANMGAYFQAPLSDVDAVRQNFSHLAQQVWFWPGVAQDLIGKIRSWLRHQDKNFCPTAPYLVFFDEIETIDFFDDSPSREFFLKQKHIETTSTCFFPVTEDPGFHSNSKKVSLDEAQEEYRSCMVRARGAAQRVDFPTLHLDLALANERTDENKWGLLSEQPEILAIFRQMESEEFFMQTWLSLRGAVSERHVERTKTLQMALELYNARIQLLNSVAQHILNGH